MIGKVRRQKESVKLIDKMLQEQRSSRKETVLHYAAYSDENVQILLDFEQLGGMKWKKNLDSLSIFGTTPLFDAVKLEQFKMADKLMSIRTANLNDAEREAEPNAFDSDDSIMMLAGAAPMIFNNRLTPPDPGYICYDYTFAGAAASRCSLEIIRYLYARGYDFDCLGENKLARIISYIADLERRFAPRKPYSINQSFVRAKDQFLHLAIQYERESVQKDDGTVVKRLIPSLHNLCSRVVIRENLDTTHFHPMMLMVRDDLTIEHVGRSEFNCRTDIAVREAKRKTLEDEIELAAKRQKFLSSLKSVPALGEE